MRFTACIRYPHEQFAWNLLGTSVGFDTINVRSHTLPTFTTSFLIRFTLLMVVPPQTTGQTKTASACTPVTSLHTSL